MHISVLDRCIYLGCNMCGVICSFSVLNAIFFSIIATGRPFTRLKEVGLENTQSVFLYYWIGFDKKHQT